MNPKTADIQVRGRIRVEHGTKRIHAFFPLADVHTELLAPDGNVSFYTDEVALYVNGVKKT